MLSVAPLFIVRAEHTALVLTVTVTPLLIVTVSDDVGTADPPQVAVLFQLPVTEAVLAAAKIGNGFRIKKPPNKRAIINSSIFLLSIPLFISRFFYYTIKVTRQEKVLSTKKLRVFNVQFFYSYTRMVIFLSR
jgi:hypothetical protein